MASRGGSVIDRLSTITEPVVVLLGETRRIAQVSQESKQEVHDDGPRGEVRSQYLTAAIDGEVTQLKERVTEHPGRCGLGAKPGLRAL